MRRAFVCNTCTHLAELVLGALCSATALQACVATADCERVQVRPSAHGGIQTLQVCDCQFQLPAERHQRLHACICGSCLLLWLSSRIVATFLFHRRAQPCSRHHVPRNLLQPQSAKAKFHTCCPASSTWRSTAMAADSAGARKPLPLPSSLPMAISAAAACALVCKPNRRCQEGGNTIFCEKSDHFKLSEKLDMPCGFCCAGAR